MRNLSLKMVLALALLVGFTCGTVYAQDYTIWNNTLWKVKQTIKGSYFGVETNPTFVKLNNSQQVWGVMTSDETGDNISFVMYKGGKGEVCTLYGGFTLVKQAGSPVGFFADFLADVPGVTYSAGLMQFTTKLKNGEFKKGTFKSLGAYSLLYGVLGPGDLAVVGLTMSGTTVDEVKCTLPLP